MRDYLSDYTSIISAENSIIGRLASIVAKRLLNGEKIIIVNADKGLISGKQDFIATKYSHRYRIKTKSNPLKGPFYPRKPEQILKRTIRGMLPYRTSRGKEAYHRLIVFKDLPETLREREIEEISEAQKINPKSSYLFLSELHSKI
ncbi:MAG: 50S ribosomal protein L13 [Candidatus Hodarchaeota archaeon]